MRMLIVAAAILIAPLALAQKKQPAKGAEDAKMKQMMEAMEKAGAPGPMHEWLKTNIAGSWTTESKMSMPNGETKTSAGTSEVKPVHGDRFLVEEFAGTRMGKPMTGTIWWGYDNMKKQFTSAEIDSVGTSLSTASGTLDEATKTLTLTGVMWSHMANREVPTRLVVKVPSDKKHTVEIYAPGPDGKESRRVEVTYTRK